MPCALGKVCNWDTVVDSVQPHKKGTKNTQAVAETNSNEIGRTLNKKKEKCGRLLCSSVLPS